MMDDTAPPDPFAFGHPPASPGRVLLARAFAHWCTFHHGYAPAEVATALRDPPGADPNSVEAVTGTAHLLGTLLASGRLSAWSRPIGGGPPMPLPQETWELDDFRPVFGTSAICPERPFDAEARRTHWVFVDVEEFGDLLELSCDDVLRGFRPRRQAYARHPSTEPDFDAPATTQLPQERHVRLPELKNRTGLSRSTIYSRMGEGRFPQTIPNQGNIAAWRESEVAAWLADPR